MLNTAISTPKDETLPQSAWQFDSGVTAVFDDMLSRSIPQYDVMRQSCLDLATRYIQRGSDVVDIGCSRGEAMAALVDQYGAQCRFIGLDVSEPMLDAARERFTGLIRTGVVDIRHYDLRQGMPACKASVILSVLTIQFTPIEYRLKILKSIYDSLLPGGALIFVEKILGATADLDGAMVGLYYGLKAHNGYSQEQIERKRLSLEGVLVPVTAKWNEELLHMSGFREIDCFWRWMNFAGWVAVK